MVANGEEGEPASVKDRWLLRNRPHLVLDGLRLAARIVAAERAFVYVSDPQRRAASRRRWPSSVRRHWRLTISVVTVEPGYVAGEETAAVRAINGGPAKPTDKPPRPFEDGVGGHPTLVSNVETLANLPSSCATARPHSARRARRLSPGTFLATITGAGRAARALRAPARLPVADLLALHGVSPDDVRGVLMGGYFAGLLNRDVLDATLDHETMRAWAVDWVVEPSR